MECLVDLLTRGSGLPIQVGIHRRIIHDPHSILVARDTSVQETGSGRQHVAILLAITLVQ
jgi:hypothetical protein